MYDLDASLFRSLACFKRFFHSVLVLDSMATRIAGLGLMPITAEQFATTLENMSRAWEAKLAEMVCILRCISSVHFVPMSTSTQ